MIHSASSASGSAPSRTSANADTISVGSCWYPSLQSRHIDDKAGGKGSIAAAATARGSGEDVIRLPFLVFLGEALRLQIEHRAIASLFRDQLVVRAQLDDATVLDDANAIGMAHR